MEDKHTCTCSVTVHPQLSEPLWSGGCSDKSIVQIAEIILNASINITITPFLCTSSISTSMNTVSVKKNK